MKKTAGIILFFFSLSIFASPLYAAKPSWAKSKTQNYENIPDTIPEKTEQKAEGKLTKEEKKLEKERKENEERLEKERKKAEERVEEERKRIERRDAKQEEALKKVRDGAQKSKKKWYRKII